MKDFIWYDKDGIRHFGKIAATSRTIIGWQNIEVSVYDPRALDSDVITAAYYHGGYTRKKVPIYDHEDTSINIFVIDDIAENNNMVCDISEYMQVDPSIKNKRIHYAANFKINGELAEFFQINGGNIK